MDYWEWQFYQPHLEVERQVHISKPLQESRICHFGDFQVGQEFGLEMGHPLSQVLGNHWIKH